MRFSLITVAAAACMLAGVVQAAPMVPQDTAATTTTQQEGHQQKPATGIGAIDAVTNGEQEAAHKAVTGLVGGDDSSTTTGYTEKADQIPSTRGKSGQDLNGLSPAQQFCAYHSVSGSAGLHKLQHKVQNALLGGSLECTLVKSLGVKMPEGYGYNSKKKNQN